MADVLEGKNRVLRRFCFPTRGGQLCRLGPVGATKDVGWSDWHDCGVCGGGVRLSWRVDAVFFSGVQPGDSKNQACGCLWSGYKKRGVVVQLVFS